MLCSSNSRVCCLLHAVLRIARSHLVPHLLLSGVQVLSRQVIFFFHVLQRALYKHTVDIEQSTDDMLFTTKGHFHMNNQ